MTITLLPAQPRDLDHPCPALLEGLRLGFANRQSRDEPAAILAALAAANRADPWGSYWASAGNAFVGICGFKAEPDWSGSVEIAYYTFPRFEGRGVATGMAASLVAVARSGGAREVVAHTLPVAGASAALLARNGFALDGAVEDPEDGEVWRWSLKLR
jgi:RimJ/RimL family protein N-acetyltransferase